MAHSYPMMVDLQEKNVLVVGGGKVAERKIRSLLPTGANIMVVSPTITDEIRRLAKQKRIQLQLREYQSPDGNDCFFVIAATNQALVNLQIYEDAQKRNQWINVVDQPSLCNFTVPSVFKRGKLTISVSTEGASPSLSKQIRHDLESQFGDEYALLLEITQEIRSKLQWEIDDSQTRYRLMKELVNDRWIEVCRLRPQSARSEMLDWIDTQIHMKGGAKCGN
ncbi:bifunctional precorrin-2 dehydrogenase/sirohydrochlorin ferrochelatase [Shimazuella sp. AN120528]|uniref:precorrin-2 dehydrogenase/sirohydrochlorin ferrochelatase family protein n=1 Tax=Shimazuella soli TaxID=1892854 RepID=UPI001F0D2421|nr:bifunctional precorrin-2 dehydrogenase/sirohydrochlorin ferrochelatase [Shimazuella soli]MCH5584666.1 bifunctional precorrin-2 dehydrogenase/sirohydrochlorin ferrochelatase [Shimazuella soli]